ncbi:MAG: InlB B-repeat-containing protein, partial [Prevotellaceae bacterium]|nr:InlB B-repeat-containing protein [Prevotellaceae bacterium]
MDKAKIGDILVVAPEKKCNTQGRAMIIENINDASVEVYQADYKGNCAVTTDTIAFDAFADYHCVSLLRSTDYPYPEPIPPTAVGTVTVSGNEFDLNESVNVSWNATKHTNKYKVYLLDDANTVIQEKESPGNQTSILFDRAGKYKIRVVAHNEYGDGQPSVSEDIIVYNQNIVTFFDYDGTILTTQKVEFGKNAIAPYIPQRKGYQFAGWNKSFESIKEPTDITATYEIEKYTIRYYDIGGKSVLDSETVAYGSAANPPTNYSINNGYEFAGWQISFDSVGTDYKCVDGDMSLIATQKWANMNTPIEITVDNVYRDTTATYYSAKINVKNHDATNGKKFKLIGTLKASNGKALKIVVLDEISLKANGQTTVDESIVFSEKASTLEVIAVGMVGNSKTGGSFSSIVSSKILDNSSWGSWSGWTTSNEISNHDDYQTKTQYRYRDKTYTTSNTTKTLSGWIYDSTTATTSSWSSWSKTKVTAQNTDALKREVQTREIAATYKTQYRYGRYRNGYNICACKKCGENVDSRAEWTYQTSAWVDSPVSLDTSYDYSWPSNSSHNHKDLIYTNYSSREGIYRDHWYKYVVNGEYYYFLDSTRQVVDTAAYTQYRYRDTTYVHKFYKWNNWSNWSDSFHSGDATATRTVYRYRDRDVSGDTENIVGKAYAIEGTLNSVESDFAGLTASIMVYRKCNTDPTEEQLEYVGATTIGENNSYSFSFIPKEHPSQETGDYIVALGIEGADRLVNVDVIKADIPKYQVKFIVDGETIYDDNAQDLVDSDGNTYRAQLVEENGTAIVPELPEKTGYTFVKWSETLTGIKTNKVITAEYVPNEYSIVFIDWDTNTITTQKLKYGDTIIFPELPDVEGVTSRVWDKQDEGITTVTDNMIIESVSQLKEYDVRFEYDGDIISAQKVKYGKSAVIPKEIPQKEGMVFAEWVGDCSSKYITE